MVVHGMHGSNERIARSTSMPLKSSGFSKFSSRGVASRSGAFLAYLDYDGDGDVDIADCTEFRVRFGVQF